MRERIEAHREELIRRGDTPASRFSEQELEDRWAADILRHEMEKIKPTLPDAILEHATQNLVDILASQAGG